MMLATLGSFTSNQSNQSNLPFGRTQAEQASKKNKNYWLCVCVGFFVFRFFLVCQARQTPG